MLLTTQLQAQEKLITGVVNSASDGYPLPGANVIIQGTTKGTQTDFDGKFKIQAKVNDVLVFNYIGFITQSVKVGTETQLSINLKEDIAILDEVVVVGYGTSRKQTLVGSVSTIRKPSANKIKREKQKSYHSELASQIQSNSVEQVANESIGHANITNNSNSRIFIRGISTNRAHESPLIIVDGVECSSEKLEQLNPDTIKSFDVIKDVSSTAIYGSKGNNGVILLSTKNKTENLEKEPLYIVDGKPIKKENNFIVKNIAEKDIAKRKEYKKTKAKDKFGSIAKNGCIEIITHHGGFTVNNNESYAVIEENSFKRTTLSPLSTFSIDVDKASYSNIRRMINTGVTVEPDAVKIEEMINYFDYNYPQPKGEHPFSIHTEVAKTPWHNNTKIVKIGLQGKTYNSEELPASNLTFLIDVSGSMGSSNKLPLLKSAFKLLVNQMREQDRVSIVVYAGAAGVVLEPTSGKHKEKILKALDNLNSGGSTAGGQGIKLAYELANKNFKKKGNNRVILATDGDFNVGASSDKAMQELIEEKRKSGVFLSVLGFGYGNYQDSKLEILADKGNGNHAYIDNMQEAQKVFGKEFGGTLYTIAKDVKIQIEFNPSKVQAYRLIGYENRMLEDEDFIDDTIDAGELGSGHTVTALYEVIPTGVKNEYLKDVADLKYTKQAAVSQSYNDELFTVKFRYKKPDGNKSIEMIHTQKDQLSEASNDLKFASAVALFGMQLRHSKYYNDAKKEDVLALAKAGRGDDENGYRSEFLRLVKTIVQ